jgi:hypothetical protein
MAGFGDKPFGLREIKLMPLPTGTAVTLPAAMTLSIEERVQTAELRGDDKLQAVASYSEAADWELEEGGISLEAYALMTGRTVTSSGTTPNGIVTLAMDAQQTFPYFKIYGRSIGASTDNVHVKIWKAKLTSGIKGSFKGGEFFVTSCKGVAVSDGTNGVMSIVQNETAAVLPAS